MECSVRIIAIYHLFPDPLFLFYFIFRAQGFRKCYINTVLELNVLCVEFIGLILFDMEAGKSNTQNNKILLVVI